MTRPQPGDHESQFLALLAFLATAVAAVAQGGGAYNYLDSLLGLLLLVVGLTYQSKTPDLWLPRLGFSLIIGLACAVMIAAPADYMFDLNWGENDGDGFVAIVAILAGLVLALFRVFPWPRRKDAE